MQNLIFKLNVDTAKESNANPYESLRFKGISCYLVRSQKGYIFSFFSLE